MKKMYQQIESTNTINANITGIYLCSKGFNNRHSYR